MMNCAALAETMSLREYEGRLYHWNEANSAGEVEAPDPEIAIPLLERINADPRLTH